MKLVKGEKYDVEFLANEMDLDWTDAQVASDGTYQLHDYFDVEGRYLGPDIHGVEPVVTAK